MCVILCLADAGKEQGVGTGTLIPISDPFQGE